MDDITNLLWKDLINYEGIYKISEKGDIMNVYSEKILKQHVRSDYKALSLHKDKKGKTINIHKLVANNFLDPPESEDMNNINHIDGDKFNNHYTNLEWVTSKRNNEHAQETGLKNNKVLPVLQFKMDDTFIREFASIKEASKETGASDSKISMVCKGKRKSTGNFKWKYKDEINTVELDEVKGVEIKDFPRYLITRDGKIYSKSFKKFISTRKNGKHIYVSLYEKGYKKDFSLSHIVAEAYIPNINNYPYVIHKNNDHTNNSVENLEWSDPTITMKKYIETKNNNETASPIVMGDVTKLRGSPKAINTKS